MVRRERQWWGKQELKQLAGWQQHSREASRRRRLAHAVGRPVRGRVAERQFWVLGCEYCTAVPQCCHTPYLHVGFVLHIAAPLPDAVGHCLRDATHPTNLFQCATQTYDRRKQGGERQEVRGGEVYCFETFYQKAIQINSSWTAAVSVQSCNQRPHPLKTSGAQVGNACFS